MMPGRLKHFMEAVYRSSFRSPSRIHPAFLESSPKIQVRTAGRMKQIMRIQAHILGPSPDMAV